MTEEAHAEGRKNSTSKQSKSCSRLGTSHWTGRTTVRSMFQQNELTSHGNRAAISSRAPIDSAPRMKPDDSLPPPFLRQQVLINGMRPLALTKKQAIAVLGSAKLVDRMLWATRYANDRWFVLIREGRDLLVATESVESAYTRLVTGEQPPLMPSERKQTLLRSSPQKHSRRFTRQGD